MMRPISTLSAPMKAVYLFELIFRSKRMTGMPASKASSTAGVMVCDWLGETTRRSTPSATKRRICSICRWLSSSADEKRMSIPPVRAATESSSLSLVRQISSLHCETPITSDFFLPPQAERRSTADMSRKSLLTIHFTLKSPESPAWPRSGCTRKPIP